MINEDFRYKKYREISNFYTLIEKEYKKYNHSDGYAFSERLIQELSNYLTDYLMRLPLIEIKKLQKKPKKNFSKFYFNNKKKLQIKNIFFYSNLFKFLGFSILVFLIFLFPFKIKLKKNSKFNFFMGFPEKDLNLINRARTENKINKYLSNLGKNNINIIKNDNELFLIRDNFIYSKYPFFVLSRYIPYSSFLIFFKLFLKSICFYFMHIRKSKIFSFLYYDFFTLPLILFFNQNHQLCSFNLSNTNWTRQFFWFKFKSKKFKSIFSLYSTNSAPIKFKDSNYYEYHPQLKMLLVDEVHAFNKYSYKQIIEMNINSKVILSNDHLYLSNCKINNVCSKKFNIVVYDTIPFNEEHRLRRGIQSTYYSYNILRKFLDDILYVVNQLKLSNKINYNIYYSAKRNTNKAYDKKYVQYINSLIQSKKIIPLDKSNEYEILSKAKAIISVPFVTKNHLFKNSDIKSIYYDSSGNIDNYFYKDKFENILFLNTVKALRRALL